MFIVDPLPVYCSVHDPGAWLKFVVPPVPVVPTAAPLPLTTEFAVFEELT